MAERTESESSEEKQGEGADLPEARASDPGEPPGGLILALTRVDNLVGKIEIALVAASLALLVGVAVFQFVAVNLLSMKADWADELVRYSVFFTAMSAAALAAQQKKMMAIDVVPRLLKPKVRAITRVGIAAIVVFACYLLFRGGLMVRASIIKTPAPYRFISGANGVLALPIGAALIGFHFFVQAVIEAAYLAAGQLPPSERLSVH